MTEPNWEDLRADGRVVFDFPRRKMAIYPNDSGGVILLTVEDGRRSYFDVYSCDFNNLDARLSAAMAEAQATEQQLEAEYLTHCAIEKARN